jgi:hypothetical protein
LTLNISSRDDLEWLRPATGRLVALEKLEVIGSGSGTTVPDFFLVTPRLRQVSLANSRLVGSSPNILLPWDQITHYRGIYSERTQLDILQMAPNMVKCAVSFTYPRDMSALDESCAILPHLRRLDIELPRFLIRINAPLLEELFCDSSWTMDVIALHHFVRRSGSACSLTKLTLRCCTISTELVAALRDLPALTFLLIECDDDSRPSPIEQHEALCDAMTISSAADVDTMCPSLTSLVYGFGRVFPQILPLFFAMVQSRIQGSCLARLRVFPAYARLEADLRIENAIQRLHDAGLDAAVVGEREAELLKTQAIFL